MAVALALVLASAVASALGLTANRSLQAEADSTPSMNSSGAASAAPGTTPGAKPGATPASKKTPAPNAHAMKFGLDYAGTLLYATPAQIHASLQDAVDVGAKWIRIDLPWEVIQPDSPSTYRWSKFDTIAQTAGSLGLKIDAILDSTAYWDTDHACKASGKDTQFCPPADLSAFANFAAAATRRYHSEVGAWEIWNEPNIAERWWPKPDAGGYAQMLAALSRAILGADPHAFIMLGGMAAVPDSSGMGYVSQNTFLTQLANIPGALGHVQAISYHPFSAPTLPSAAGDFQDVSTSQDNLLSILQSHNYPNIQIWITESGDSVGASPTAEVLSQQAAYATNLVKTVSANPNVAADFWFADQDIDSQRLWWGLRDGSGKERPAYAAFKSAIAACGCSVE